LNTSEVNVFHQLIPTTRLWLIAGVTAVTLVAAPAGAVLADDHISSTGAAILGGIAGLAVGAAIVDNAHQHPVYYPPRYPAYAAAQPYPYAQPYPAYYPRPAYRPAYRAPFSPAGGVVCYPGKSICYNNNGSVAGNWTHRVFGY
jgi:hypothetical protein